MDALSCVSLLTGTEFLTESGRKCRIGFVRGKWGTCPWEQHEGAKEQSVRGGQETAPACLVLFKSFSMHTSLKPVHPECLTGEDSWSIRALNAGQ